MGKRAIYCLIYVLAGWSMFYLIFPTTPRAPGRFSATLVFPHGPEEVQQAVVDALRGRHIGIRRQEPGFVWGTRRSFGIFTSDRIAVWISESGQNSSCVIDASPPRGRVELFYNGNRLVKEVSSAISEMILKQEADSGEADSAYALYQLDLAKERTYENRAEAAHWLQVAGSLGHPVGQEAKDLQSDLDWLSVGHVVGPMVSFVIWTLIGLGAVVALVKGWLIYSKIELFSRIASDDIRPSTLMRLAWFLFGR